MKKNRVKVLYVIIGLFALMSSMVWTYHSFRTNTTIISYIVDAIIIIMLLLLLFNKNGKLKKSMDHINYMEWITDGNVENCSKLSVSIRSLEDLVKLAIDMDKRVIHDSKLGKYFVLSDNMTYIHDPGLANPFIDNKQQLGKLLIDRGLIQPEQLETGLYYQKRIGCRLGESLIALGFIDETILYSTLAAQQKIAYYELDTKRAITDTTWLNKMSLNKARALQVLPLGFRSGGQLVVACGEVAKSGITAALQEAFGTKIYIVAARPSHIYEILEKLDFLEKKKSGYNELLRERRVEAYEHLTNKEWEQFTGAYYAGKIETVLFVKATGLVDPIHLSQAPNQDIIISWLTGKGLISGQMANLIKTLEKIISRQDKNSRIAKILPDLLDLLKGAYYITEEEAAWVKSEYEQELAPINELLESNYLVATDTIENANIVLGTLTSLLNKAKIY